ncbi:hypothetical protein YC2023_033345 [Brassica napus]
MPNVSPIERVELEIELPGEEKFEKLRCSRGHRVGEEVEEIQSMMRTEPARQGPSWSEMMWSGGGE